MRRFWYWLTRDSWLSWPYSWVRYRTWDRYHVVRCHGLKPGYHEPEEKLLHSMFGILVEFVEVELANHNRACDSTVKVKGRESAMDYLGWAMALKCDEGMGVYPGDANYGKPTRQAEDAKEIKALYEWWIDVRPLRQEPGDASGYYPGYEALKGAGYDTWENGMFIGFPPEVSAMIKKMGEIEEQYDDEDTEIMKRLVEVRRSLWT